MNHNCNGLSIEGLKAQMADHPWTALILWESYELREGLTISQHARRLLRSWGHWWTDAYLDLQIGKLEDKFLRMAVRHHAKWRSHDHFRAWCRSLIRHFAASGVTARESTVVDRSSEIGSQIGQVQDNSAAGSPRRALKNKEMCALAHSLVESLPESERTIVRMLFWGEGETLTSIAKKLGLKRSTASSRLHRALRRLRRDAERRGHSFE